MSKKLNVNKQKLEKLEKELEEIKNKPTTNKKYQNDLEQKIKEIYIDKTEAAIIRSKCRWFKEGEAPSKYFFQLEKSNGEKKLWNRIKKENGTYKTDIDSIIEEQINFYYKLLNTEGWDSESGELLLAEVQCKLDDCDVNMLDRDISDQEIYLAVMSLKPNKSPGEDGILSTFYQIYWDIIKNEFSKVIKHIFHRATLCDSQTKGVISLIHKGNEREDIKNWRPLTMLNNDYKIIAKILAERLKKVLPKLIHPDQKGFVKGRNISDANRLIQDIIDYADNEDLEGAIIFLDQQKAFDRIEWGWVEATLKRFNFGKKYCDWIKMLLIKSKTCIKTNGFVSKYFPISRSARQGCPIAPLLYVLQIEPMACAIRQNPQIKGILIPNKDEKIECKINMFADDTQLFNKDEESIINSFNVLEIYEKASGAKINFSKTKGRFIGKSKGKTPNFKKIQWIKTNIKTLGVNHGYGIDTNAIWLEKIEKIKNSLHVWKTRNLTFKGKTLIIKNLIIPIIGYEIEMRGIPDIYAKQINDIVWSFIWDNKLNKIDRNVCCLSKNEGGMNMINIFNFIKS